MIANIIFIAMMVFFAWFVIGHWVYADTPPSYNTREQSDRQKENNDYNNDYYP